MENNDIVEDIIVVPDVAVEKKQHAQKEKKKEPVKQVKRSIGKMFETHM